MAMARCLQPRRSVVGVSRGEGFEGRAEKALDFATSMIPILLPFLKVLLHLTPSPGASALLADVYLCRGSWAGSSPRGPGEERLPVPKENITTRKIAPFAAPSATKVGERDPRGTPQAGGPASSSAFSRCSRTWLGCLCCLSGAFLLSSPRDFGRCPGYLPRPGAPPLSSLDAA